MQNKKGEYLKKIELKLFRISCTLVLFMSMFSLIASAEDTNIFSKINPNDKVSAKLSSEITNAPATKLIPVIIILKDQNIPFNNIDGISKIESKQKNLTNFLTASESGKKVQKMKRIHIVNAVAAEVTPDIVASLANMSGIEKIEPDAVISIAKDNKCSVTQIKSSYVGKKYAWGVDSIGAPDVWQRGITGKGITVAVIDSGIDVKHPDLDDLDDNPATKDPKVVGWIDYINGKKSPYDDLGHGTNIAGIISGTGACGICTGVAPGTKLIGAKVFDQYGLGHQSDVILAFEWAVNNGARVICFSGGGSHNSSFSIALDKVVAAGVTPVVAAGNFGPDPNTITCPGDEINSTTVGDTDISDTIDIFSSRGPVDLYGLHYVKPDVSAPGVDITTTALVKSGCAYENMSGTSMAAPHVSGTIALMMEKNPTLKPSEIKCILENTAVDLGRPGKDNDYGSGRINAYKAVFYEPISFNCKLHY